MIGINANTVVPNGDTIAGLKYISRRFVGDCVRAENLATITSFFTDALGASFETSDRPELGLRIRIALESGLDDHREDRDH